MAWIVIAYGLISGLMIAAMSAIFIPLMMNGVISFSYGEIIGYSSMVLAYILVFFGIRSYRDKIGGGSISFGKAFKVGILITLVTCAVYVIGWEIVYWGFIPDFGDKYAAFLLDNMRQNGASAAEIAKASSQMETFKRLYKNPLFNVGMTFLEVFPVGLIMTLISAAILRRKPAASFVTSS